MLPFSAGREASSGVGAPLYVRHRPERTLLYQIVEECYPAFKQHLELQDAALPGYVQQEFDDYLKCGRLEHGFLQVRCDSCHAEHLVAFSCKRRGFCPPELRCAAHGGERGAAGRRGVSRAAGAPVGAERPVPNAFPVREPPRDHGAGAGHRLPCLSQVRGSGQSHASFSS